jgi:hypothetical protein
MVITLVGLVICGSPKVLDAVCSVGAKAIGCHTIKTTNPCDLFSISLPYSIDWRFSTSGGIYQWEWAEIVFIDSCDF